MAGLCSQPCLSSRPVRQSYGPPSAAFTTGQPPHGKGITANTSTRTVRGQQQASRPAPTVRASAAAGSDGGGATPGPSSSSAASVREVLDPRQRTKMDGSDDRQFYASPRYVHHLDARFRAQLTQLYRERIPEGADILDLCSSWVSHLPTDRRYGRVVGHGLNAAELGRNPQLTDFFVRNLNAEPSGWALQDASVDAVLCTASVQYLQRPEAVLAEVARVLRPGGVLIVSFSNRMFYQKAIAAWRDNSDFGRCSLVKSYVLATGAFGEPEVVKGVDLPGQGPLGRLQQWGEALLSGGSSDPFFAVVAYRQ